MPSQQEHFDELDQTRFSVEEPMFEGMAPYPVDDTPKKTAEKVPLLKQRKVIIGLIVGVVFLVLLILLVISSFIAQNRRPTVLDATPLPLETKNSDADFLEKKVNALQKELEAADPNKRELTFPSVDFNIRIDEKKTR